MGYETRLYIVNKSSMDRNICLIDSKVFSCYTDDEGKSYYYFIDGNTRASVPADATVKRGNRCEVIAMIELCNAGDLSLHSICKFADSDGSSIYSADGNNLIGLDDYSDYRKFIPITDVIEAMEKYNKTEGYRRFHIALATLKTVAVTFPHEEVGCLCYGH